MRLIAVAPTKAMREYLNELGLSYEIVKSADKLSDTFRRHDGFFDGVIAPNNPPAGVLREIGQNWFVKERELPIFAYGSRITCKERFAFVTADAITTYYRGNLLEALQEWVKAITTTEKSGAT
jgi:hypothetical protein